MIPDNGSANSSLAKTAHKPIIAGKPSVARAIAAVIGAIKRQNGYLEGNGYLLPWCAGPLVELAEPRAYPYIFSKRYKD